MSESGIDVIAALRENPGERTSWHTHIDNDGNCVDAYQLVLAGAPEAYEPQGVWGYSLGATWLDETLAIVGGMRRGFNHLGYLQDVQGRIHSLWRDGSEWEVPPTPTPTSVSIMRLESPDAPAGELLERAIPGDCEYVPARVRDDGLQVVQCREEPRLRGYAGAGSEPVWAVTLGCNDFEVDELSFDVSGRLWLNGRLDGEPRVVLLRW